MPEESEEQKEMQDKLRKAILDKLTEAGLEGGGFLKGYAVMAEWVGADGRAWLTQVSADAVGDELPDWQVQGYFHNYLHTDWPTYDHDEDEE